MSKIVYREGPATVSMGVAGKFEKNVPREVGEELIESLLQKKVVNFKRHPTTGVQAEKDAAPRGKDHKLVFEEKIEAGNEAGGGSKKKKRQKVT